MNNFSSSYKNPYDFLVSQKKEEPKFGEFIPYIDSSAVLSRTFRNTCIASYGRVVFKDMSNISR